MTTEHDDATARTQATVTARILATLDELGLRNTRPRRIIAERLAALAVSGADFSAHDLWLEARAEDPHLGRATVYRAVDALLAEGIIDRIALADGTRRYRACGDAHHHHVTCVQCQRVVEVEACLPPELISAISASTDFAIEGHSLELYGRCPACRRAGQSTPADETRSVARVTNVGRAHPAR